jgi:hypothetical protein
MYQQPLDRLDKPAQELNELGKNIQGLGCQLFMLGLLLPFLYVLYLIFCG